MKIGPYTITSDLPLTREEAVRIAAALPATLEKSEKILGGRGAVRFLEGVSGKNMAIKPYLRGGAMGRINRRYYLGTGETRAAKEYACLKHLSGTEVITSLPLGFIESGCLIRSCWLMMETVPHTDTLATAPLSHEEQTAFFTRLAPQMNALLSLGIHHVDLHPGNIIVTDDGHPVLIDFDKARDGLTDEKALSALYIERWTRAVKKHHLPESLSEGFAHMMASL